MSTALLHPPLLLALFGLTGMSASAIHYKLFVLTGQSNSLGVTNGGEPDPTIGTDAADQRVPFFWDNVANANTALGNSGGTFTTLRDQQGGFYSGSATHWGPEITFARTLSRAGVRDFAVVKASRGGGGNSNWHKASNGHMYTHVTNTVTLAQAALKADGHISEVSGLLYLQGESDSASEALIAGARFKEFIDNLRSDLIDATNLHAVIGGIAAGSARHDTVRAQQAAIADSTSYINYFDSLDLQSQLHDGLHFNRAAKVTLGDRFAHAWLATSMVHRHYGKLVFIGDSITQGGQGFPGYRYRVFTHLATAGVPKDAATGYQFVGSLLGAYQNNSGPTPDINGQSFHNQHDGHWGWRALWENGRTPLPASRRSGNRGEGTLLNWTGQAAPNTYAISGSGATIAFPDPTASDTGIPSPYTPYTPDTAVIMLGINDLASGSPPTQVRDDIARLVDQLQSANPNVRCFLSQVLYTNQSATRNQLVDTLNALLPALAQHKTTATSPVWVIDTNAGFDPVTLTYDAVHPNASGEIYVGDRIAGGLAIIALPPATLTFPPPIIEKGSAFLETLFKGNDVYSGTAYTKGWSELNGGGAAESLIAGNILHYDHSGFGSGTTLDGTATGWTDGHAGNWTLDIRLKLTECSAGFALWLGTGTHRIIVELYNDRTQDYGGNSYNVAHNNEDGAFHTYRVAHDAHNDRYHVWRDGARLTPVAGAPYDQAGADSRLLFGDYTGNPFGNNFDVEIEHIRYDQSGAYLPVGADADNDGLPDVWEYLHFRNVIGAAPGDDADHDQDSNLREFLMDTDPFDTASRLHISSIGEIVPGIRTITVAYTSPQRQYTLFACTNLRECLNWVPVPGQGPVSGTNGLLQFEHTSALRQVYRTLVTSP